MSNVETPRRPRLDRRGVIADAIVLADAEGIQAVSMRALAARLGVVPMALYKHVADKDDLIGGMVDQLIEDYPEPPDGSGWKTRVRARVLAARSAVVVHPWLGAAIDTTTRRTETVLGHMNAIAGDFIADGVSADLAHFALHALGNRIWGYSSEAFEDNDAPTPADADQPAIMQYMMERFPFVVAIAMDTAARNPAGACNRDAEFEFTLDLLLDSIERLHATGWASGPRL